MRLAVIGERADASSNSRLRLNDVLDRTAGDDRSRTPRPTSRNGAAPCRRRGARARRERVRGRCAAWRAAAWQFFVTQSFSSLTRRIVSLNVAGLVALVVGILYLSQFRAGLIDARVQSLLVQGEIIAGAIAASATVDTDCDHHRSRPAARIAARRELRPDRRRAHRPRIPDQSRARRAGAAPPDLADQDARAHLRPRRRADPRQPQSLQPRRRAALRPAAARREEARR